MTCPSRRKYSGGYFPILKWRHRELAALSHLDVAAADCITPIFELPPEQWNFDFGRPSENLRVKYANLGIHLLASWKNRRCAIDAPFLEITLGGSDAELLDFVFHQARSWGCIAIPVFGWQRTASYLQAVKRAIAVDGHGACLRLHVEDVDSSLALRVKDALDAIALKRSDCDLVIDFGARAPLSAASHVAAIETAFAHIPHLSTWRNVIIASTSIPAALPHDMFWPRGDLDRLEWSGFIEALCGARSGGFDISYSDYGVVHPNSEMVDPRLIGRDLSLVYAREGFWSVYAPNSIGTYAIENIALTCYRDMLADTHMNDVRSECWADKQIRRLAQSWNPEQAQLIWPQLATNRHLSVVGRQLGELRRIGSEVIDPRTAMHR